MILKTIALNMSIMYPAQLPSGHLQHLRRESSDPLGQGLCDIVSQKFTPRG